VTVLWDAEPVVRDLMDQSFTVVGEVVHIRVHVHVMRGKIEGDQELEKQSPTGVCDGQKGLKACSSASTHQLDNEVWAIAYLSVTISRTAPNLEVWFNALAACPSTASRIQETK
jgi:hypothetical protein